MLKISRKKPFILGILFFGVLAAVCPPTGAAQRKCKIAIVKSGDVPIYNVGLEGFNDAMREAKIQCDNAFYDLGRGVDDPKEFMKRIRAFKPDVILTVGSQATGMVSENVKDIPTVFAMVLYPVASGFVSSFENPGRNLTGAAMDVPIERQLQKLSRIVPKLERVGVLYSPAETLSVIEEAKGVAKSMGLVLLAEEVESPRDVPNALERLRERKIDALWSVADGRVFTQQSTVYMITYAYRRGIPLMGYYGEFVEAGALVGLWADYRDCGRQAGEITIRILNGTDPRRIPVAAPRTVITGVNLQVARHIGIEIPQPIIDEEPVIFQ